MRGRTILVHNVGQPTVRIGNTSAAILNAQYGAASLPIDVFNLSCAVVAEGGGFEPPLPFRASRSSNAVPSASQPPLRSLCYMRSALRQTEWMEQLNELSVLGCNEVQGYLLSRPKPADEILPPVRL